MNAVVTARPAIIVAWADSRVIGRDGELPWHLPNDLKRFQRLTMGHHLILGRRTWESIGEPLAGRGMIVVSRRRLRLPQEVQLASSPQQALARAVHAGDPEPMIAGGAAVYSALLPDAGTLYLTRVHAEVEGDVRFPPLDLEGWTLLERQDHAADPRHDYPYTFLTYRRANDAG